MVVLSRLRDIFVGWPYRSVYLDHRPAAVGTYDHAIDHRGTELRAPGGRQPVPVMLGEPEEYLRCLDCDLLQRAPRLEIGESARCPRCGAILHGRKRDSIDRTLALVIAAMVLWLCSNFLTFMTFEFKGQSDTNTIATGVRILYERGFAELAVLIDAIRDGVAFFDKNPPAQPTGPAASFAH